MNSAPLQIGPFALAEPLGEGGMGSVFRATHNRTGVDVAMKVVKGDGSDEFQRQFHREVQAHAGLVHPGIVYLFDYGETPREAAVGSDDLTAGSPWVAMGLADRGTVRDLLPMNSWHQVRKVLVQTLDALAYAHAREVIHRDLKPENLLVFETDDGRRIKLADFGIAHAFDDVEDRDTDQLQSTAGTPLYMAPEQIRGRWRSYGPWTDLYALGCIAYQLVCGKPPFVAENPVTLTVHHCNEGRPRLDPQFPVPEGLESWIQRAMAIDPDERFWRAADAARALPVGDDISSTSAEPNDRNLETMETIEADNDLTTTRVAATKTATLPATEILTELAATETENSDDPPPPSTSRTGRKAPGRSATSPATGKESAPSSPNESLQTSSSATSESGGSGPTPHGGGSMGASRTSEKLDILPHWQTDDLHALPTPLVGTGLGLFNLREPPFVDREVEREILFDRLEEVRRDDAFRIVLICGPSGTGKSRLARWMTRRADELAVAAVLEARHSPGGDGPAEGLGGMIRRSIHGWRLERSELYQRLLESLPPLDESNRHHTADARALTELVMPTDPDGEIDGPRYSFDTSGQKYSLMERFFRRIGHTRTPLVWIDDLQWSREAPGLLHHLVDEPERPAGMFVATIRSEELAERPALADQVERLAEHELVERLDLTKLASNDHRAFIEQLLSLEAELADQIADRTAGNPLFAHQLLGSLVATERLDVGPDGFRLPDDTELRLPDDIHQLWESRLTRLLETGFPERSGQVRQTIELAATLNQHVNRAEWRAVCRRADLQIPDGLVDLLVDQGLVERTDQGWSFTHRMFVESLHRFARRHDRYRRHHRHCAEMLGDRLPSATLRRIRHWLEAEYPQRALSLLREATHQPASRRDPTPSRRLLDAWRSLIAQLDPSRDDPVRLEYELTEAIIEWQRGDADGTSTSVENILARCNQNEHPELAFWCHRVLSTGCRTQGESKAAKTHLRRALTHVERGDRPVLEADVLLALGWHEFLFGNHASADQLTRRAIDIVEDEDEPAIHTRARIHRGWILLSTGDFEAAEQLLDSVLERSRRYGFRGAERDAATALGDLFRYRGEFETAIRYYRRQLDLGRELGKKSAELVALLNLALAELGAGRLDRARFHLQSARDAPDEFQHNDHHGPQYDILELGLEAARGRWSGFDERLAAYRDESPAGAAVVRDHCHTLEVISDCCLEADRIERARQTLETARDLWGRLGDEEAIDRIGDRLKALEETDR